MRSLSVFAMLCWTAMCVSAKPLCTDEFKVNFAIQPDGRTAWVYPRSPVTGKLPLSVEAEEHGITVSLYLERLDNKTVVGKFSFSSKKTIDFVAATSVAMDREHPTAMSEITSMSAVSDLNVNIFLSMTPTCGAGA